MKQRLLVVGVLVLLVAILVAGYYLGVVMAIVTAILGMLGMSVLFVAILAYTLWDAFSANGSRRRHRDT